MIGVGIGIPFFRSFGGGIDAQAQAHFNRVIADGGVVPSGLSGVNAFFSAVKAIYGTSDINTAISAAYDPHYLGYKLGAGSGTTLGQAAQKLYSVKSTENLLLQSEDFGSANWTKLNSTITTNTTTAPNGTMTADSIVDNTTNAAHRVSQTDLSVTSGTTYTLSAYIRKGSVDYLNMAFGSTQFGTNGVFFDLTNFSVFSVSSGHSASITNEGSGWYRVTFTANCTSTGVSTIFINPTSSNVSASYIGNGSTNLIIWGAQLNTGSVALPYTQTTTTAQTLADVVQTTAASQPLLLAHTGENYWQGVGVAFNFVSTPNVAANQITGDIEINARFIHRTSGSEQIIIAKNQAATNQGYRLRITNGNNISFTISLDGSTLISVLSTFTLTNNQEIWVRCTRNATTGVMNLFTSNDGITYTLNNTATNATGNIFNTTSVLTIGSNHNGASDVCHGKIYRATIANSIGGTPVVDFNPSSYNPSTSQTQWSSATGEVWTINTGTATTGYKGVLVDRSIVQGDGIDDGLVTGSNIIMNTQFTLYGAFRGYNNEGGSGKSTFGKQNIDGSVFRNIATFLGSWIGVNGGAQLNQTADSTKLNLATFKRKVSSNTLQVNNGAVATNTASTAITQSAISVFSVTTYGSSNSLFTTGLFSYIEDDATQKTAMYNYLRSLNNNAF